MLPIISTETGSRYVRVYGWRNDRILRFDASFAYLEITLARCQHCATCSQRVAHIEQALIGQPHDRIFYDGCLYVQLPLPAELTRTFGAVRDYVAKKLRLSIS